VRTKGCSDFSLDKLPNGTYSTSINTLSWLLSRSISYFLMKPNEDELVMSTDRLDNAEERNGSQNLFPNEMEFLIDENDLLDISVEFDITHNNNNDNNDDDNNPLVSEIESSKIIENKSDDEVYKSLENAMTPKLESMNIPSWSAFNSSISKDKVTKRTKKLYFPFVPAPASDYSAIYTALMISQGISVYTCKEGGRTVITMDLDLYERTYLLIHSREDLRDQFVLRLGELHIIFAHIRAIGAYIDRSGIERSWLEAEYMGSVTVALIKYLTADI